jgi:S-(hydroxymethyl)glutathione dehydrogenase/alcohol dehydrogenase
MRMKAAVLYGVKEPLVVEEVELDPPKAGEALIKMVATGICHSDPHRYTGDSQSQLFPIVLGHEGAGIVEEVGEGVTRVKKGDHVVLTFLPSCGKCRWCHTGHPNKCDLGAQLRDGKMLDGTTRIHRRDGSDIYNFLFNSTYAEYSVAPEASLVPVPEHLPLEKICLFGCGFTTGFGTATNKLHIRPGETITIVGCGGLGLAAIQGARLSGAGKIIAVDIHPEKLEMAKKFGATHGVLNKHNVEEVIQEITDITWGVGTDYSIEFVGFDQSDETLDIAFQAIRKGGTMCMVGIGAQDKRTLPFDPLTLTLWRKKVTGVLFGEAQFQTDIPRLAALFEQGQINLDDMITRELSLDQINEGFQAVLAGNQVARQVIRYS